MSKDEFITELFTRSLSFSINEEPFLLKLEMEEDLWVDAVLELCKVFTEKAEELEVLDGDERLIMMILNSMSFSIKQDSTKFISFGTDGLLAESIINFCSYAFKKLQNPELLNNRSTTDQRN